MKAGNHSFTVRELRKLGITNSKLVSLANRSTKCPLLVNALQLRDRCCHQALLERSQRQESYVDQGCAYPGSSRLGQAAHAANGQRAVWDGELPASIAGNVVQLEQELLPFLREVYGDGYDLCRNLIIEEGTCILSLPLEGLTELLNTSVTVEKLDGDSDGKRSLTLRTWSMASVLTDIGLDATLNIVRLTH